MSERKKAQGTSRRKAEASRRIGDALRASLDRHHRGLSIALLVLGAVLRIVYWRETTAGVDPTQLTIDERYHHEMGGKIAHGQLVQEHAFFRAPLYYYLLGGLYRLVGPHIAAAVVLQLALSVATCLLVWLFTRELFGKNVALIALAITACYGPLIYFAPELLFETLLVFFCVLAWLLLLRAERAGRIRPFFVAGLVLGLAIITRPNVAAFAVLAGVFLAHRLRQRLPLPAVAKCTLGLLLGCLLPIAPVTLHNYLADRDFVLVASQGGVNLFIGNNPEADGISAVVPEIERQRGDLGKSAPYDDYNIFARAALRNPNAKASEVDRYWRSRALAFIAENPATFVELIAKKFGFFWGAPEIGNERAMVMLTGRSIVYRFATLGFWFVCPLAAAGLLLALRDRKHVGLLILFVVALLGSTLPFFVNARFRLPITPALIVLAAYAIGCFLRLPTDEPRPELHPGIMAGAVGLALAVALLIRPDHEFAKAELSAGHHMEGLRLLRTGDVDRAVAELERSKRYADERNDRFALESRVILGQVYTDQKRDFANAERTWKEIVAMSPTNPTFHSDLGVMYERFGRHREAQQALEQSLELDPNNPSTLANLAASYRAGGLVDKAQTTYARLYALDPKTCEPASELANVLFDVGQRERARPLLERTLAADPNCKRAAVLMHKIAAP